MGSSTSGHSSSVFSNLKWEVLLAGVSGGAAATIALHPLDLVKIRFQVNEGTGIANRPSYHGLVDALQSIVKSGGVRGLYQGLMPNLVGASSSWGLYFFFYQARKSQLQSQDSTKILTATQHMVTAAQAGAITLLFTNPIWVTKTRLCLQYDAELRNGVRGNDASVVRYRGMTHALISIWRADGIRGMYKGLLPGLFGVSHGALQFMAYEDMKNRYCHYRDQPVNTKLGTGAYLTFSALSKIFAASSTYPYQVIRSRLQDQHRQYKGIVDVISQIFRYEGVRGFYKGLFPSLLRVTPACCITFVVYENMTHWLISPSGR